MSSGQKTKQTRNMSSLPVIYDTLALFASTQKLISLSLKIDKAECIKTKNGRSFLVFVWGSDKAIRIKFGLSSAGKIFFFLLRLITTPCVSYFVNAYYIKETFISNILSTYLRY